MPALGGAVPGTAYSGIFTNIDLGSVATQLFRVRVKDLAGNQTQVATTPPRRC